MKEKKLSLEDAMLKIESIILNLENKEETLEKSIKLYKEASKLVSFCEDCINNAKQEITVLNQEEK